MARPADHGDRRAESSFPERNRQGTSGAAERARPSSPDLSRILFDALAGLS
jgi:hypothetical protein